MPETDNTTQAAPAARASAPGRQAPESRPARASDQAGRPLRVLYFLAYPQRMAGADRSMFELVTNLPPSIAPLVVVTGEGEVAETYRKAGVETEVVSPGPSLSQYGKAILGYSKLKNLQVVAGEYLPYTLRLWRLIRRRNVDLVHTNEPRATLLIGPAAKLAGRPIVGHIRGEFPFAGRMKALYERLPARFIAVSDATRATLSPERQAACATVYNGTKDVSDRGQPVPFLEALRASGVTVVCCFANVVPFKGQHHLLHAVAELNRRGWREKAVFLSLGDFDSGYPEYVEWVLNLQQRLGLDNVILAGWTKEPFSFYRSADVTVLPSVSRERLDMDGKAIEVRGGEGFPRTHLEAMCYALPIVGTDIAGVKEQVKDGTTGFVVPPSDPAALADALERLLADADLRRRMGQAGRERVLGLFSTKAYVQGVVRVYGELMGRAA